MQTVAERYGVAIVRSDRSVARLPVDQHELLPGAHPNEKMYAEIARDIVPAVLAVYAARRRE